MKTKIISIIICICIFNSIVISADITSKDVYPGSNAITFESVNGNINIETYSIGDEKYYIYSYNDDDDYEKQMNEHIQKYVRELEYTEGWKEISHDTVINEYIYMRNGYILKINTDTISKKITVLAYRDIDGKYVSYVNEVTDNSFITVFVNGFQLQFDVEPQLINNRTMVPMRAIFEALNSEVEWNGDLQKIKAKKYIDDKNTIDIEMQINRKYMLVNGKKFELDVAPTLIDGRTLVPVRAVSEALLVNVQWHSPILAVDICEIEQVCKNLYDKNNQLSPIPTYLIKKYELAGWSQTPFVTMYSEDGKTEKFKTSEVDIQKKVGWYTEPVQRLYAPGKSEVFTKSQVPSQLEVGWYEEPVIYMYADTRTIVVKESEVQSYIDVGWYTNKTAAKEPSLTKYPRHNIKIFSVKFDENSVGGIEPDIIWRNDSGKTIKYIYFTCVPYNAVNDIVGCTITGDTYRQLKVTGPCATFNKENLSGYGEYTIHNGREYTIEKTKSGNFYFRDSLYNIVKDECLSENDLNHVYDQHHFWDVIWYNHTISRIDITKIEVIYMDGSRETITNPPIWKNIYIQENF